jgi:hypothetical protein
MLWIFVFESPHNGKYDDGNGGAMFFFLGVLLGLLAAPVGGALAVLGAERMITKRRHIDHHLHRGSMVSHRLFSLPLSATHYSAKDRWLGVRFGRYWLQLYRTIFKL